MNNTIITGNKLTILKNIMTTKRGKDRRQYTVSLPSAVKQILGTHIKELYIYTDGLYNETLYITGTDPKKPSHKCKLYKNSKYDYFTFPNKIIKYSMTAADKLLFIIDLDQMDTMTGRRGLVTINLQ